jgi:hypothetical protein
MTKLKYVDPKNEAELTKLMDGAIRAASKAREAVQVAAVAILIHAGKHGDWTKANVLVEGLGNTINGQALVAWFITFGGLQVNTEGTAFGSWAGAEHIKNNLDAAKGKMWWELRKQNAFAGYNATDTIMKFVRHHKELQKKIAGMKPEDASKISFVISDEAMLAVLNLVDFEHIVQVKHEADATVPEQAASEQADRTASQQEQAA